MSSGKENLYEVTSIIVRLGIPFYTYLTFGINLVIVIFVVAEATRTRFWSKLPRFNCLDVKSAILGTAAGVQPLNAQMVCAFCIGMEMRMTGIREG